MAHTDQIGTIIRTVDAMGITLFGLRYNSVELQQLRLTRRSKKAKIALPLRDLREISVKIVRGPTLKLQAKALADLDEPVTVEEWLLAYADANAKTVR